MIFKNVVIITDIHLRKAFDLFNVINKKYPKTKIVLVDTTGNLFTKVLLSIIYFKKIWSVDISKLDILQKNLQSIRNKFKNTDIFYIPVEEDTTKQFLDLPRNFLNHFKAELPESTIFNLIRNKKELNIFCDNEDIPAPKYYDINNTPLNQIEFPVVAKPEVGSGSKHVAYLNTVNEVEEYFKRHNKEITLVQEKLPNSKNVKGAFFYCENGRVIDYYSHERIRTFPEKGGVTVFSKVYNRAELLQTGTKLIEKLNISGLIMIEFLFNPKTKRFEIIEINPRIWGSILLSEFSGHNFIGQYLDYKKETPKNKEVFIRWVFPYDLLLYFKNKFQIEDFWKSNDRTTFINISYSNKFRSILFHIYLTMTSFSKLLQKIRS